MMLTPLVQGLGALHRPRRTRGLVGHWLSDDSDPANMPDHSGNLNAGTNHGAVWGAGKIGRALSIDGLDDYVSCGGGASLHLTSAFSVSAWVLSTKNNATLFQGIAGKANLSGSEYGWILTKRTDNKFYFQCRIDGLPTRSDLTAHSDVAYTDSAWHNLVGLMLSNGTHYIYVDGIRQAAHSGTGTFGSAASNIPLVFGTAYGDLPLNVTRFGGIIDGVRIWTFLNRNISYATTPTDADILDEYNSRRKRYGI